MQPLRIKETCIYVSNLQRSADFYGRQLGLPLISLVAERHVFFKAGSSVLLCFIAEQTGRETLLPPHGAEGSVHFAFEVSRANYDATLSEVKAAGIEVVHYHTWTDGLRSFYFRDPDGNLLEVIEEGLWEADVE